MRCEILWMNSLDSGWSSLSRPASIALSAPTRADQVLVDRVVVVHRELHHPDDAAEIGDEPAEHAGFVHPPQRRFRRMARGQDLEEQPVGLRVLAQAGVDALQRLGDEPRRVRVDRQVRAVGDPEQPDQVDRIALEHVGADDVDAVRLDLEVLGVRDRAACGGGAAR